jgi:hypothetical protein
MGNILRKKGLSKWVIALEFIFWSQWASEKGPTRIVTRIGSRLKQNIRVRHINLKVQLEETPLAA